MHEVIAKDENGIPRCWGQSKEFIEAINLCKNECYEYLQQRKDIKTLTLWCDGLQFATVN